MTEKSQPFRKYENNFSPLVHSSKKQMPETSKSQPNLTFDNRFDNRGKRRPTDYFDKLSSRLKSKLGELLLLISDEE